MQRSLRRVGPMMGLVLGGVLACGILAAQEFQLRTIPLDRDAAEVREFQELPAVQSRARSLAVRRANPMPQSLFFAVIDPQKGSEGQRAQLRSLIGPNEEAVVDSALQNSSFDPQNMTWFETNYGPPINATLYCNWTADPALERRLEAEIAERAEPGAASRSLPTPTVVSPPLEALPDDGEADEEGPTRKFTLGGRPCVLTRRCEQRTDPLCNVQFLDSLIPSIRIIQLGN
jgi:hypothetical protein